MVSFPQYLARVRPSEPRKPQEESVTKGRTITAPTIALSLSKSPRSPQVLQTPFSSCDPPCVPASSLFRRRPPRARDRRSSSPRPWSTHRSPFPSPPTPRARIGPWLPKRPPRRLALIDGHSDIHRSFRAMKTVSVARRRGSSSVRPNRVGRDRSSRRREEWRWPVQGGRSRGFFLRGAVLRGGFCFHRGDCAISFLQHFWDGSGIGLRSGSPRAARDFLRLSPPGDDSLLPARPAVTADCNRKSDHEQPHADD